MATFDIHFDDKTVHSVDAETARHDDVRGLFVFHDGEGRPVAWAPALNVHVVAVRQKGNDA